MIKPRKFYKGQSVIEYVVLFAIVAAVSIGLFIGVPGIPGIPGIFSAYVANATAVIQ